MRRGGAEEGSERGVRIIRLADVSSAEAHGALDEIGPFDGWVDVQPDGYLLDLTFRRSEAAPRDDLQDMVQSARRAFGERVYATERRSLSDVVVRLLDEQGLSVSTAESCTGGWVAAALTSVAGASKVFWGGVVAYDDDAKTGLLAVRRPTIERHGAVSRETALEMARGVRDRSGTTLAVAVTGIAGPGGGTAEKPVGTVWIASVGLSENARVFRFDGDRREVRRRSVQAALDIVRLGCLTPTRG